MAFFMEADLLLPMGTKEIGHELICSFIIRHLLNTSLAAKG